MKIDLLLMTGALAMSGLWPQIAVSTEVPSDTYFSVAVSDNSHNHYGENLMYLDFQAQADFQSKHPRSVIAIQRPSGAITLDGNIGDWDSGLFTSIRGRVMNNYPLSEHYDAVPTQIKIGAAFDSEHIYFVLQYEDANHDASINRNRWLYDGVRWTTQPHVKPKPGAPAARAVNRDEKLVGSEDEDQIFFMFPIVDQQGNFKDGGLGCGGYCHTNLSISADPVESQIGDGIAAMHTAVPGDIADLWHWTATRSRPMNTLKDGYLDYGDQSYNGRKEDAGTPPFENNAEDNPFRPKYVSKKDYEQGLYGKSGHRTALLKGDDLLPISDEMAFVAGDSLPFYVAVTPGGSRSDVQTAAHFDDQTHTWTVEFKRKLNTGDSKDRQFVPGAAPIPPRLPMVQAGNPVRGEKLFKEKACASCHGEQGEGEFTKSAWPHPRNQRTSAPLISKTASPFRPERLQNLVFELKKYGEEPPRFLMPFVELTAQEAEDIAAYLQEQFIPYGQ